MSCTGYLKAIGVAFPSDMQVINEGNELFLISSSVNIKKVVDYLTAKKKH